MKVFHFYVGELEILHRLQSTNYSIGDTIRLKGRNGKIISIQQLNDSNVKINVHLDPKKPKIIPIDLKKLRRR